MKPEPILFAVLALKFFIDFCFLLYNKVRIIEAAKLAFMINVLGLVFTLFGPVFIANEHRYWREWSSAAAPVAFTVCSFVVLSIRKSLYSGWFLDQLISITLMLILCWFFLFQLI